MIHGATEQQKKVVAAVLKHPALANVIANMLNPDAPDALAQYSWDNLEAALKALPAASALANEFEQIVELTNGTLEARRGLHSKFEFRLTLKDVQPGQTQEKLEALVAEMNAQFSPMMNYPFIGFKVYLSKNGDLPNYERAGNVVFTCSSLIHDPTKRHRMNTISLNGEELPQEALLSAHGLVQVPNDVVRALAGMYRLKHGFPDDEYDIGTNRDMGDVFEGKVARTFDGYFDITKSGVAASFRHGVRDVSWNAHPSGATGGVIGGLSPELK